MCLCVCVCEIKLTNAGEIDELTWPEDQNIRVKKDDLKLPYRNKSFSSIRPSFHSCLLSLPYSILLVASGKGNCSSLTTFQISKPIITSTDLPKLRFIPSTSVQHHRCRYHPIHYTDVIMGPMASQITSLAIVYSTVYSGADKKNINVTRYWPLCGEFTGDVVMEALRKLHLDHRHLLCLHNLHHNDSYSPIVCKITQTKQ